MLVNTLGGDVVWARANTGIYSGTLTSAFPLNKTYMILSSRLAAVIRSSNDVIAILGSGSDNQLSETAILIEIYP